MKEITWENVDAVLEKHGVFRIYNDASMESNLMVGDTKIGRTELNTDIETGRKFPVLIFRAAGTMLKDNATIQMVNEESLNNLETYLSSNLNAIDSETIVVQYRSPETARITIRVNGDWIDLTADEDVEIKQGELKLVHLGVAMKLPEGYEGHLAPRSSTLKNFGVLQANSVGVVDNSYCGPNDWWRFPAYATRDTVIKRGERICQFRIMKKQPKIRIVEGKMEDKDRGGFGSTGTK